MLLSAPGARYRLPVPDGYLLYVTMQYVDIFFSHLYSRNGIDQLITYTFRVYLDIMHLRLIRVHSRHQAHYRKWSFAGHRG